MSRTVQRIVLLLLLAATRMSLAGPVSPAPAIDQPEQYALDFDNIGVQINDSWLPRVGTDLGAADAVPAAAVGHAVVGEMNAPLADAAHPQVPVPAAVWTGLMLFLAVLYISRSNAAARWRYALLH
jgi:hypothetical protein